MSFPSIPNTFIDDIKNDLDLLIRIPKSLALRIFLALCVAIGILLLVLGIIILLIPGIRYRGYTLSGYVSGYSYRLFVAKIPVTYAPLESVQVISWLYMFFAIIDITISFLGIYGIKSRLRSWSILIAVSLIGVGLLVNLLYSILRVIYIDIVPVLPQTVTTAAIGSRIYLDIPYLEYTWVYWLARRPLYFFTISSIAIALAVAVLYISIARPELIKKIDLKKLGRKGVILSLINIKRNAEPLEKMFWYNIPRAPLCIEAVYRDGEEIEMKIFFDKVNTVNIEGKGQSFDLELAMLFLEPPKDGIYIKIIGRCYRNRVKCWRFVENFLSNLKTYVGNLYQANTYLL